MYIGFARKRKRKRAKYKRLCCVSDGFVVLPPRVIVLVPCVCCRCDRAGWSRRLSSRTSGRSSSGSPLPCLCELEA